MPVILSGAIGGLIYKGIIGLFVGAVVLVVSYKRFLVWFNNEETDLSQVEDRGKSPVAKDTTYYISERVAPLIDIQKPKGSIAGLIVVELGSCIRRTCQYSHSRRRRKR